MNRSGAEHVTTVPAHVDAQVRERARCVAELGAVLPEVEVSPLAGDHGERGGDRVAEPLGVLLQRAELVLIDHQETGLAAVDAVVEITAGELRRDRLSVASRPLGPRADHVAVFRPALQREYAHAALRRIDRGIGYPGRVGYVGAGGLRAPAPAARRPRSGTHADRSTAGIGCMSLSSTSA